MRWSALCYWLGCGSTLALAAKQSFSESGGSRSMQVMVIIVCSSVTQHDKGKTLRLPKDERTMQASAMTVPKFCNTSSHKHMRE